MNRHRPCHHRPRRLPVLSNFGETVLSAKVKKIRPTLIQIAAHPSVTPYGLPEHDIEQTELR